MVVRLDEKVLLALELPATVLACTLRFWMPAAKLALHDVDDAFALCSRVVSLSGLSLRWHEREDLVAYLVSECWALSLRYEPGGIRFSTWATGTLRRRVVDWQRQRNGRTRWQFAGRVYERERPDLVPLDDGGLDVAVGRGGLDDGADLLPDRLRLLRARSRPPAGYDREIRRRRAG
jgi:DNA-directed RNA polymerase specialized sigma24 family protein